ncbi:MAG: AAA family ATPase [Pyrobaculum sp.]
MNILKRRECRRVAGAAGWLLVYGRRKVGKTFTLRNCARYDLYITVTRSGEALIGDDLWRLDEALREVVKTLKRGGSAVVDEFQRVPERYWDLVASAHPHGSLIISGSSFGMLRKIFDSRSPLLGLFDVYKMGLIKYADALAQLRDFQKAALWRDPWTISIVAHPREAEEKIYALYMSAMGLIGEVFTEEERTITKLYQVVLSALAEGEWNSAVVANYAAARGLDVTASTASAYLNRLVEMGLVEKIPIYGSKRSYHRISSTPLRLALYAEAKYHISEGRAPGPLPWGVELQFNIGELLAEAKGGQLAYLPHGDVDAVVITAEGAVGYEIKTGPISRQEARRAVEKIRRAGLPRAGLVSLAEEPPRDVADEAYGPQQLVEMAQSIFKTFTHGNSY